MKILTKSYKQSFGYLIIGLALIWLACIVVTSFNASITKPFTLDETDITSRANFVLERGPQIFNDGTHYFAHPPLYEYTVVLIFKLFGQGEIPLRSFGILCHLLSGLFLLLTVRILLNKLPQVEKNSASVLFAGLYLINPTLLQHSMSIDADTTEIMLFVCMYIYGFVKFESLTGKSFLISRLFMATAFALAFLSKEITPILLAVSMTGYRIVNREWKRLLIDFVFIHALGTAAAWSLWWVYCFFTSTDPLVFIKYTLIKKTPRAVNGDHLSRVIGDLPRMMRWTVYWAGAPFCALVVLGGIRQFMEFCRVKKVEISGSLLILGLGIYMPYVIAKPAIDMMKYQHPAFALLLAFVCVSIFRYFHHRNIRVADFIRNHPMQVLLAVILMGVSFKYYGDMGDYILYLWDRGLTPRWKAFLIEYYRPLLIGSLFCLLYGIWKKKSVYALLILFFITSQISINAALNLKQQAGYVTAESWMNYGETGHKKVVDFFRKNVRPNGLITSRKDIDYYLQAHHQFKYRTIDIRKIMASQDPKILDTLFKSGGIQYIMLDRISLLGFTPEIMKVSLTAMSKYYRLVLDAGTFKVYGFAPQ